MFNNIKEVKDFRKDPFKNNQFSPTAQDRFLSDIKMNRLVENNQVSTFSNWQKTSGWTKHVLYKSDSFQTKSH